MSASMTSTPSSATTTTPTTIPAMMSSATGRLCHRWRSMTSCCSSRDAVRGAGGHQGAGCACCWPFSRCPKFTTYSAVSLLGLSTFLLFQQKVELILTWLLDSGDAESFLLFLFLFTLLSFPMTWGYILVNVVAGYRFGLAFGTFVVIVSVAIGSVCAFVACRSLLAGWIQRNLLNDRLEMIISVVEGKHGFSVIALTRLTPIPFGIQNGVFALSKVPVSTFMTASFVGLLPTQFLNSYMGSTLRSVQDLRNQKSSTGLLLIQVLVSILLSVYVIRVAQRALHKRLDSHQQAGVGPGSGQGLLSDTPLHDGKAQDPDMSHHATEVAVESLDSNGSIKDIGSHGSNGSVSQSHATSVGDIFIV